MKAMRGSTLTILAISLAVTCLAYWGCAKKAAETPAGGGTQAAAPAESGGGGEVSMAAGEQVFKTNCATCHGEDGRGDGPTGAALNPKPRNFHDAAVMDTLTDAAMFNTITNGKPPTAMPAWGGILTDSQIHSVMLKVRSFRKEP